MNVQRTVFIGLLTAIGLLPLACTSVSSDATPNVDATVQAAIAQTRTFEAAVTTSVAATAAAGQPTAGAEAPDPTATDAPPAAPTDTPPAASAPTATPSPPPPTPPPTPTEEKLLIAESDVDGDDGNDYLRGSSESNQGRVVLLPGFEQSEVTDPVVFRENLVFRVEVFDTRAGSTDGAGIQDVTFRIELDDGSGHVVYERREQTPGYCAFGGGEPDCNVLRLGDGSRWPDPFGGEIQNGVYLARIDIIPEYGEPTQWRWNFSIDAPAQVADAPPGYMARINSISVQDDRFVVDFETPGYEPVIPGQHVHFFFNSVPPEEAGMPGGGPWQIYPTGPGEPNTSPFTLYTLDQRPPDATQMCILVANEDHSVIQGSGNCVDLP